MSDDSSCLHPSALFLPLFCVRQREGMLAAANARIRALSFHVTQLQAEEKLVVRLLVGSEQAWLLFCMTCLHL